MQTIPERWMYPVFRTAIVLAAVCIVFGSRSDGAVGFACWTGFAIAMAAIVWAMVSWYRHKPQDWQ